MCYNLFMKNLFKISIILLFCIILSSCFARENDLKPRADDPYYPTQADMLEYSHKRLDKKISRLNKIYDKLAKTFQKNENFVRALKKNQELFHQYRDTEREIILSHTNIIGYYGSNYGIYSDSITLNTIEKQISNLRMLVDDYCLYNHYEQDENACKPETLDKIFK